MPRAATVSSASGPSEDGIPSRDPRLPRPPPGMGRQITTCGVDSVGSVTGDKVSMCASGESVEVEVVLKPRGGGA